MTSSTSSTSATSRRRTVIHGVGRSYKRGLTGTFRGKLRIALLEWELLYSLKEAQALSHDWRAIIT